MQYTRDTAIAKLLESYRAYFNIIMFEEEQKPLTAICEFFEHSEKFVLSRKAELWSADCEEFIYLFDVEHLTNVVIMPGKMVWREHISDRGICIHISHRYLYVMPVMKRRGRH